MNLREIVYDAIKTVRGGGMISKDERLSERLIAFKLNRLRSDYIANNGLYAVDNPQLVQDLGCLDLCEVDMSECPDLPFGLKIKKVSVPKAVSFDHPCEGSGFSYVGSINKTGGFGGGVQFNYARAEDIADRVQTRFGRNFCWYYIIGGNRDVKGQKFSGSTLYVVLAPAYEDTCHINVRMIADDPTDVCYTGNDGKTLCFDWDNTPYPTDGRISTHCFEHLLQVDMGVMLQTTDDAQNEGTPA